MLRVRPPINSPIIGRMARNRQLILNRYRPIEEAGAGGFGSVQVAWDTRIQRRVAIKCIELDEVDMARMAFPRGGADAAAVERAGMSADDPTQVLSGISAAPTVSVDPVFADDDDEADLFSPAGRSVSMLGNDPFARSLAHVPGLDEARTAAMLSDASIVAVYDFEVQGSTAYLIMEDVEGMSLGEFMRRYDDRMNLDIIAAVFSAVSHALEVAHANQVLHLDIKPDNILINRQGQVKVTDFGLATLADASGFGTAGGGTIGYMPLEQMRQETLDVRCDEWALASVTYEMLAGENPFLAPDLERAEAAIEDAELVLPSLCWDNLDAALDDVVFYALDPDREERYATVTDFAEELEPFLGDPKRGGRELASIVGHADEGGDLADDDAEAAVPPAPRVPPARAHRALAPRRRRARAGGGGFGVHGVRCAGEHPANKRLGQPVVLGVAGACRACGRVQAASGRAARIWVARCGARRSGGAGCRLRAAGGGYRVVVFRRARGRRRGQRRLRRSACWSAWRRAACAACGRFLPAACPRVGNDGVLPVGSRHFCRVRIGFAHGVGCACVPRV